MYGCKSWTTKKAEYRRINAFDLWCWRRLLRVPWTARRSNQSILKEISPEYSLEGLMLKLKLQSFGHLMRRANSLEKTLMLGKNEVRRRGPQRMRCWMASPTHWTWVWVKSRSWCWTGRPGVLRSWGRKESNTTERLNWSPSCNPALKRRIAQVMYNPHWHETGASHTAPWCWCQIALTLEDGQMWASSLWRQTPGLSGNPPDLAYHPGSHQSLLPLGSVPCISSHIPARES